MIRPGSNTSVGTVTNIVDGCSVKKENWLFEMQLIKDACFSLI